MAEEKLRSVIQPYMYYGYRCYNKEDKPLGWLYTFDCNTEYAWTDKNLHWCKCWKTERGAKKHFENYNRRWQFKSKGGYLKIEIMPKISEPESEEVRRLKILEEWGNDIMVKPPNKDDDKSPTKKTFKFELSEELPDSYGVYLFLMKDNSIQQAYYGSFSFPHYKYDLIICDCQYEETLYRSTEQDILGWLKPIE